MKWLLRLALGLFLIAWSAAAAAAPEFQVQVTAAGPADTVKALEQRTRELLYSRAVQVDWQVSERFRPRDVFEKSSGAARARIWLDARDVTRAMIYLVDDAHERFLVRVVPLEAGYDEVACESVGTIIESSVDAWVDGVQLGVDRQSAEQQLSVLEKPAAQSAPAPERALPANTATSTPASTLASELRIALELAYRLQLLSSEPMLLQGPDLGLILASAQQGFSAFGFVQLGYRLPTRWQRDEIGLTLQGAALRAGPGIRWTSSSRLSLAAMGLLGLDWLRVKPTTQTDGTAARAALSLFAPTLGFALEAEVSLFAALSAALALGFDADLFGNHFDVLANGRPEVVLDPWRFQPFARVALRAAW